MDVKIVFLNGHLFEEVYMFKLKAHEIKEKENMVCRLKKSLCGFKQALREFLEFDEVVTSFIFK